LPSGLEDAVSESIEEENDDYDDDAGNTEFDEGELSGKQTITDDNRKG
jgi:hypothetical protein